MPIQKIMTTDDRLVAIRLRAATLADLAFALANATTLAEAYEAQHWIEQEVESNQEFLSQVDQADLGYVGDKRKWEGKDLFLHHGMDERNNWARNRAHNAIAKEFEG